MTSASPRSPRWQASTALITGGSRGLGRALALDFARQGYTVYATGRDRSDLDALEVEARPAALEIRAVSADAGRAESADALIARLMRDGVRLDVVVHNAALLGDRVELADYPLDVWDDVIRVNVRGPFLLTQRLLPLLAPNAALIFVTSGITESPHPRWGGYFVSKLAVEGIAATYAIELKPRGIRVFVVNPGPMRTDMRAAAFPKENPKTLATPEERTGVFLWLAQDVGIERTGERFEADEFAEGRRA